MNDETIENLLRKAPALAAPEELRNRLQTQIRLPQPEPRRVEALEPRTWLRRFMPALSLAAFFVACVLAIGIQTSELSQLQRENEALRAATQNLDQLRAGNQEFKRLQAQAQELEQLRKGSLETQRLRSEVEQLRAQLAGAEQVKAENQRLQAVRPVNSGNPGTNATDDFFAKAQARAERIMCVNNLKQIGLAARIWANDHGDVSPMDFLSMSNELVSPIVLKCPSDKSRSVTNWSDVAAGNVSYQMDAPGIDEKEPNVVFAECPIHHNILMVDGSVQQMSDERIKAAIKIIDGKKVFMP